eukprot:CAMPEP_0171466924 /NCGR_PEP_ID=MMETSP0945-20130129/9613_1 /TAXON_ID=109269 /ORGANISM="Vaucheria litorea, Strain CCMP2940" /LENGTH=892 /DNA_ID=CAMNT_0011995239 /DNA_START=408 /DNA_END=3086 /DNA_ORIENTATION=-
MAGNEDSQSEMEETLSNGVQNGSHTSENIVGDSTDEVEPQTEGVSKTTLNEKSGEEAMENSEPVQQSDEENSHSISSNDSSTDEEQESEGQALHSDDQKGWRVKLYQLNIEGQWDDKGTGYICCKRLESLGEMGLHVINEVDSTDLLQSKLLEDDVYQRQGENIITWNEPKGAELALSFQENQGCLEIWGQIADFQGESIRQTRECPLFSNASDMVSNNRISNSARLPEPSWENLPNILETLLTVNASPNIQLKESIANSLLEKDAEYFEKLLAIFSDGKDLEDHQSLRTLCAIFKFIICLNDAGILETVLSDKFFISIAEVFEHDPELKQQPNHREFLEKKVQFREILPIEDPETVAKIIQNFRVTFLKETLLRPMMDDVVAAKLNGVTYFNNNAIVCYLYKDSDYVKNIFQIFQTPNLEQVRRRDVSIFLKELTSSAKTLPQQTKDDFYTFLWEEVPLFDSLAMILSDQKASPEELSACIEILLNSLSHDPSSFRAQVVRKGSHPPPPPYTATLQPGATLGVPPIEPFKTKDNALAPTAMESKNLLFWAIHCLTNEQKHKQDEGLVVQSFEACRLVIESETTEAQVDRESFLRTFYEHYIQWLVVPFWNDDDEIEAGTASKISRAYLCDLLSYCVRAHTYRMKYFLLRNHIVNRVLRLTRLKDKFLQLAAVRFLRSCVGARDEFYNRYIVKDNLFKPILQLLKQNAGRDNLIISAILELLEFIRAENIASLVEYIVERFEPEFSFMENNRVLQGIIIRFEQNRENKASEDNESRNSEASKTVQHRRRLFEEDEDEPYFNESNDEADNGPPPLGTSVEQDQDSENEPPLAPLVPYDDDDDEDVFFAHQRSPRQKPKSIYINTGMKRSCNGSAGEVAGEEEGDGGDKRRRFS